jgi:fumarylacetoacetase
MTLDDTHEPALRSWVESANDPDADFPIQNLPFGTFRRIGSPEPARIGVAIGDQIFDAAAAGIIAERNLNELMALGPSRVREIRAALSKRLRADAPRAPELLVPMRDAELLVPAQIGDYTDFYASLHHATNVGSMFRPDNPLLPNYKWVPIGYHGRASSIVASGTPIRRPSGQTREAADAPPAFGPSRRLDYELEVGAFIGSGNALGEPIAIDDAERHVFGLCLVNDWSARDIQTWEYQPLGPFLAKNFATTVSPWVVTLDALAPFRAPAFARAPGDPAPLPHLSSVADARAGGFDITLEVWLDTERMRANGRPRVLVSRGNFTNMYWTVAQLVAHHASNGCNLRPGDLLASGTVSGPDKESRGCLLERSWRGTEPLSLPGGEQRAFLENGDHVVIRGYCARDGFRRIGFGECRGMVVAPG